METSNEIVNRFKALIKKKREAEELKKKEAIEKIRKLLEERRNPNNK